MAMFWLLFCIGLVLSGTNSSIAGDLVQPSGKDCKELNRAEFHNHKCGTAIAILLQHYTGILRDASPLLFSSTIPQDAKVLAALGNCTIAVEHVSENLGSLTYMVVHSQFSSNLIKNITHALTCFEQIVLSKLCENQPMVCDFFQIYSETIRTVKHRNEKVFGMTEASLTTQVVSATQLKRLTYESTCFLKTVGDSWFLTANPDFGSSETIYKATLFVNSQKPYTQWRLIPVDQTNGMFKLQNVNLNEYLSVFFPIGYVEDYPEWTYAVTTNTYSECNYHFLWRIEETTGGSFYLIHNSTNLYMSVYKLEYPWVADSAFSFMSPPTNATLLEFLCSG